MFLLHLLLSLPFPFNRCSWEASFIWTTSRSVSSLVATSNWKSMNLPLLGIIIFMPHEMRNELFNAVFDKWSIRCFRNIFENLDESRHILNQHIVTCDDNFGLLFFLHHLWLLFIFHLLIGCQLWSIEIEFVWGFFSFLLDNFFSKETPVNIFLNLSLMLKVLFINITSSRRINSNKVSFSFILINNFSYDFFVLELR